MAQLDLYLKLEHDASILEDFYSGVDEMDAFIHTRLSAFLRAYRNSRFYVLRDTNGTVIAMFVTSEGRLVLDEDCKDDLCIKFPGIEDWSEIKDYWEAGFFPSIEIEYLAVRKAYREQHIGTDIISIIKSLKESIYSNYHPLFLSVNAYCTKEYSAVGFYKKCNFWAAEFINPTVETLRMYRAID